MRLDHIPTVEFAMYGAIPSSNSGRGDRGLGERCLAGGTVRRISDEIHDVFQLCHEVDGVINLVLS
jgi:hypothetical protein